MTRKWPTKMINYISIYLLIIQNAWADSGLKRKRPRNFESINHDNFVRFWNLNFDDQNGVLVHTGEKTIAYSIITNGTLRQVFNFISYPWLAEHAYAIISLKTFWSHEFWNLVEDCNSGFLLKNHKFTRNNRWFYR